MRQTTFKRTKRSLVSFILILFVFLLVADSFVITQQSVFLRDELNSHAKHEFDLFGRLVGEALTKGDFSAVEEAVRKWGEDQQNILVLNITAENGFSIASFKRNNPTLKYKHYEKQISFGVNNTANISMIKDTSRINALINKLTFQLISGSILLVAALGFLLQRIALRPLQNEISEHKRTEQKLEQHTAELRESNNELESYSYSIAHDLRAPLRSITSFSQILQEEAQHKLSNEEKEHFSRIIAASKRMAELIDDILELGRITRTKTARARVDLTAIAKKIANQLTEESKGRKVEWHIHEGISAIGDEKLFSQLLDNLLSNAWKFSSQKECAYIEFGKAETQHDNKTTTAYFVKDNGTGFNMQYADKVFQPFQRLTTDSTFSGTGVGLATVQRIIQRHGGNIWVETKPDEGATFYFTLPNSPPFANTKQSQQ